MFSQASSAFVDPDVYLGVLVRAREAGTVTGYRQDSKSEPEQFDETIAVFSTAGFFQRPAVSMFFDGSFSTETEH